MARSLIHCSKLISLLYIICGSGAHAAFTYTAPAQCENLTVNWSGGKGPFSILLAPRLEPARNISIPSSAYDGTNGNYTFQLQLASQLVFLIVLSDSTGFGSLGATSELTVNTSSATCDTSTPTAAFNVNFNATDLQQCRDFTFDGFGGASKPITIHGLIPQGTTFNIAVPSTATDSYSWNANIALGMTVLFIPQDGKGTFASSSDFLGVGSSSTSSCLNSTSPQTTGSPTPSSTSSTSSTSSVSSASSNSSPSNTAGSGSRAKKSSNTGAIVGGVVGGLAALVITLALVFWSLRRKKQKTDTTSGIGFTESKSRGKSRIDLLPVGGADTNGSGENGDGAARYPLSASHGAGDGPNDYVPVPYVLPPGEPNTDGTEYDPYRSSTSTRPLSGAETSTVAGASSAAGGSLSKAAMAALDRSSTAVAPNTPARFLVHEDAGSLEGDQDDEYSDEEVVDLPPQYNSLGVLMPPERRLSRRRSTRRPVSVERPESSAPGGAGATVPPIPAIPESPPADAPAQGATTAVGVGAPVPSTDE